MFATFFLAAATLTPISIDYYNGSTTSSAENLLEAETQLQEQAQALCGADLTHVWVQDLAFKIEGCGFFAAERDPKAVTYFFCYPHVHASAEIYCNGRPDDAGR